MFITSDDNIANAKVASNSAVFLQGSDMCPGDVGASFNAPPKGTLIWGDYTFGMTVSEVQNLHPSLVTSPEHGLSGKCKLFSFDGIVSFDFDHEGGLENLLFRIDCTSDEEAAYMLERMAGIWEMSLCPPDHLHVDGNGAQIRGDGTDVTIYMFSGDSDPHLMIFVTCDLHHTTV